MGSFSLLHVNRILIFDIVEVTNLTLNSCPLFLGMSLVLHTLDHATQFYWLDSRLPMRKHYKRRFTVANVCRLNEVVATDTYFSDTPDLDAGLLGHGGTKMVQLFCGCQSLLTAVYRMRREGNTSGTLENCIRQYGAPNSLFTENAKSQIHKAVHENLRMYAIKDFQLEPHHSLQIVVYRKLKSLVTLLSIVLALLLLYGFCVYNMLYTY
jgi:hypothetical protein